MANALPLLLVGGAAVAVLASGKKKKSSGTSSPSPASSSEKIIKEGYSYTKDCKRLYFGDLEVTERDLTALDMSKAPDMEDLIRGQFVPAVREGLESVNLNATGMPYTEAVIKAAEYLAPECKLKKGVSPNPVALALISGLMSTLVQEAVAIGVPMDTVGQAIMREMYIISIAPKLKDGHVDLIYLIEREKANPSDVAIPAGWSPSLPTIDPGGKAPKLPPSKGGDEPTQKPPKIKPFVPEPDEPQEDDIQPGAGNISVFPPNYQPPVTVPGNTVFIDPQGEGYAIGEDFEIEISIKGKKYSPAEFFEEFTPDEDPINSWLVYPAPATADFYTTQLMKVWGKASGAEGIIDQMPGSGGMKGLTELQYFNQWMAFAEKYPAIAALFFDLQEKVGKEMMLKLYDTNAEKYTWVFMHYHAENALIDYWDEPIADITDQAYYATWPSAPEKITSKTSKWAKRWNKMLGYVNDMRTDMVHFLNKSSGELPSWRYIEDVVEKQIG